MDIEEKAVIVGCVNKLRAIDDDLETSQTWKSNSNIFKELLIAFRKDIARLIKKWQ